MTIFSASVLARMDARKPGSLAAIVKIGWKNERGDLLVDVTSEGFVKFARDWLGQNIDTKPIRDAQDRSTIWTRVRDSWKLANHFGQSLASRGPGIVIGRGAKVDKPTFDLRVLSCHGGNGNPICEHRRYEGGKKFHYCNFCGCGAKEMAALDAPGSPDESPIIDYNGHYSKLVYPFLVCPANRPGFSNEMPPESEYREDLIIQQHQGLGDAVLLSGAIRDLHLQYPGRYKTAVEVWCEEIFRHNPNVVSRGTLNAPRALKVEVHTGEYPTSDDRHFIHCFHRRLTKALDLSPVLKTTKIAGDIHLSDKEKAQRSPAEEYGLKGPYWVIWGGAKSDIQTKAFPHYQRVIDLLRGKVQFVQVGAKGHIHKPLDGALNLVGRLNIRQTIRLVYRARGVVSPISFGMHLAAAVPVPDGFANPRPCVVVAGGRESLPFIQYEGHKIIHSFGKLDCCSGSKGCWKFKAQPAGDSQADCKYPVQFTPEMKFARCMVETKPEEIADAVSEFVSPSHA